MAKTDDDWLAPFARLFGGTVVLELGCGDGRDTAWLLGRGHDVVALDRSPDALTANAKAAPEAWRVRAELGAPLPFRDSTFDVVVASLSLHYFGHHHTRRIMAEVRRCLARRGVLLARFNSTNDIHHGARGHAPLADGLYLVGDRLKRFFTGDDVAAFRRDGWQIEQLEESCIDRYQRPKFVWTAVLRRAPD